MFKFWYVPQRKGIKYYKRGQGRERLFKLRLRRGHSCEKEFKAQETACAKVWDRRICFLKELREGHCDWMVVNIQKYTKKDGVLHQESQITQNLVSHYKNWRVWIYSSVMVQMSWGLGWETPILLLQWVGHLHIPPYVSPVHCHLLESFVIPPFSETTVIIQNDFNILQIICIVSLIIPSLMYAPLYPSHTHTLWLYPSLKFHQHKLLHLQYLKCKHLILQSPLPGLLNYSSIPPLTFFNPIKTSINPTIFSLSSHLLGACLPKYKYQ